MKNKILCLVSLILYAFSICLYFNLHIIKVSALEVEKEELNTIVVYNEEGEYLCEKVNVQVGDEYIDKNLNCYIIISIDEEYKTATAKFKKKYQIPKVKQSDEVPVSIVNSARGTIGLYMTHNDESYVSGDGYDSVYGEGGIHDIAKMFSVCLNSKKISTVLDETLHIPHDSYAYSRSSITAKNLLSNNNLDAIFDIHRDGTSRGYYVTKVNGEEKCMVRIVIGKANPNYEQNKAFALFLLSVASTYAPWLFVDIYMATGHYNQALSKYALLFEMGSHLVEKSLVLKTVPTLAEIISIALYGNLEIVEDEEVEIKQNEILNENASEHQNENLNDISSNKINEENNIVNNKDVQQQIENENQNLENFINEEQKNSSEKIVLAIFTILCSIVVICLIAKKV